MPGFLLVAANEKDRLQQGLSSLAAEELPLKQIWQLYICMSTPKAAGKGPVQSLVGRVETV